MNEEKPKVATSEAPAPTDTGLVARGQAHATTEAAPESKLDRSKGELPATIDGALDDLILREPRKYGVLAVLRMLAVWARGTQQISERVAALREENAALRAQ